MDNFYEKLKSYFENTPREQVLASWEATEKYDAVGPTVEDFLAITENNSGLEFKIDIGENYTQYESPEVNPGFFVYNCFYQKPLNGKSCIFTRELSI